jgi:hypothetical protein
VLDVFVDVCDIKSFYVDVFVDVFFVLKRFVDVYFVEALLLFVDVSCVERLFCRSSFFVDSCFCRSSFFVDSCFYC